MPTLFVTAPPEAAEALASGLVEERLAACVNRIDCHSTYRWEGEVHAEGEVVLLVKTTADAVESCTDWLAAEHPYEVPCVECFDDDDLLPAYADWQAEVVAAEEGGEGWEAEEGGEGGRSGK